MKAVRIHRYGGPEVLQYEHDAPEPELRPDTVLIEAAATSVNPIDWKIRSGARRKDFPLDLPAILGKDVSGVVKAVGGDVRDFKPGDRVLALAEATYAQYVVASAAIVVHLPDGLDPVDAAAIPLVCLTGEQLVRLTTEVTAGQRIIVTGALGSVGRAAVHTAKMLGAKVIAGVRGAQAAEAEELEVSSVLALDDEAAVTALESVDAVADTVGGETAGKLFDKVREGGRFSYTSVLPEGVEAKHPGIKTGRVFARPDPGTLREFAEDVRSGAFVLPISRRMPLSEAGAAQALLEKGGGGKIILTL